MALNPLDYEAIRNLYGRYSIAVDTGDPEMYANCFAEDGTLSFEGLVPAADRNGAHSGREKFKAMLNGMFAKTQGHCLHISAIQTIEGEGDEAQVIAYAQVLRRGQAPYSGVILTGVSRATVVRSGADWVYKDLALGIDPMPADWPVQSKDVLVAASDDFVAAVLRTYAADPVA
jgi:uncharacterized protein (TIGR02246 family)